MINMKRTGTSIERRGTVYAHSDESGVRQHSTETPHKAIQHIDILFSSAGGEQNICTYTVNDIYSQ